MNKVQILFELIKDNKFEEFINYLKDDDTIDVNIRDTVIYFIGKRFCKGFVFTLKFYFYN